MPYHDAVLICMSYFTGARLTLTSSQDIMGLEYSFTQESDDNHGSWQSTQLYPAEIQVYDSASLHPQLSLPIYPEHQWNGYANCGLPNESTQSSPNVLMTNGYSPSGSNCLSPFTMQTSSSLPSSSLPQLSPTTSDPSLSPLYSSSRLSTPSTPLSSQSFMPSPTFLHSPTLMPSPTLSQGDQLHTQDSQVSTTSDVCHIHLFICFY